MFGFFTYFYKKYNYIFLKKDEFFEKIPDKSSIELGLKKLIHESISINCNYSSMIEVY